ncbi:MAG: GspE/PulE family protein [Candidatus Brocadiae bacterium]|nr:GspE/PulE family protein [Candidatus Brocadiia bacterium]
MALFKKEVTDTATIGNTTVMELKDRVVFENKLRKITNRIHSSPNIDVILLDLKEEILSLLDAERITIYAVTEDEKEIYSKIKVGDEIREFRVAIDNTSIAGYVAKNKKILTIKDVYDVKELAGIDPALSFNRDYDFKSGFRTKQMLVAPILFNNKIMGVIQLINKKTGECFLLEDTRGLTELSETLAIAFNNQKRVQKRQFSKYDLLLVENLVVPKEIEQAILISRETGKSVSSILVEKFKVRKEDIGRALSHFYRVPFFEFKQGIAVPVDVLGNLEANYLRNNLWVPLKKDGNKIVIVVENPQNLEQIDSIKRQFPGLQYEFMVSTEEEILKAVNYFLGADSAKKDSDPKGANVKFQDILSGLEAPQVQEAEDDDNVEADSALISLVNQIIAEAHKVGTSDIHIEPVMDKDVMVRIRVDGHCRILQKLPGHLRRSIVSRIKIMANLDIAERRKPQDGKIQMKKFGGPDIELRVATLPTVGGMEDVVMRILAASKPIPLDKIGMTERNFREFTKMLAMPYGIILVVGPTGSGKTTSLHSALGYINKPQTKIWTAEDPVEITQEGLRQVQVQPKIGYTFATAMRAFLRADPNVIMVGEMRDHETAAIGVEASLTGHLVLSTLHTNSAPETIVRLLDIGIDPFNFADALIGVLAQRLVRTLCKECKKEFHPDEMTYHELADEFGKDWFSIQNMPYTDSMKLYRAGGCQVCGETGYKGRVGIHELLIGSDAIKKMVQRKETVEAMRGRAMEEGMTTLKQDGILKVFSGHTSIAQVRSVCIK